VQKILAALGSAAFIMFAAQSQAGCVAISPNPNPVGHTTNNVSSKRLR